MQARILLVDDHELSRSGIKSLLVPNPNWEVCGEATDGREALEKVQQLKPDLVIMDAIMPSMSGIEAARRMREQLPWVKIVIVSVHDSDSVSQLSSLVGADVFLTKTTSPKNLRETIAKLLEAPAIQPENCAAPLSPQTRHAT
jgi:DNA-binding NarL/FixJ family response regulator